MDYEKLAHSRLPIPPLSEQTAIARYLDHADRRVQRYIGAKRKLVKLLEEQKQAIIQQAVTGQIVFVPLRDASDPETGQRYTVRPLQERKGEGGRLLAPREDHPRARQSGLRADRAHRRGRGKLQVIAELVRVLGG